jgi:hypothetical protein
VKIPTWLRLYGSPSFRGKCPTENAEQITFFNALDDDLRKIALHPRNEGKRTLAAAQREKAEGLTPGASDIIIPGRPTFVCELKRQDHTKSQWQPRQLDFLKLCQERGAFVCVALGHEAAMEALNEWSTTHTTKNG